ncbi:hypothetical protein B296_00010206 [Ensete ventricosum]|uniref:Uncharacterized protein n=1 Tax=Ensete ventricosum TaxID=4639 RepID=A0A427A687_ENSVE|nr:hypothetical protein B296_00010206 [Ensete ventricosum]
MHLLDCDSSPIQSPLHPSRSLRNTSHFARSHLSQGAPLALSTVKFDCQRRTAVAFTSLVAAAIPTLLAMQRAATSLARLADTATEELPSTMAAIRLSGMEISDLTLELSDLRYVSI